MDRISTLEKFTAPLGRQDIELQQVDFVAGGMSLLRIRIREGKRFTIFDIDPVTAGKWGEAMAAWSRAQLQDKAGG